MICVFSVLCVTLACVLAGVPARAGQDSESSQIVINGQPLSAEAASALARTYGPIPADDYWYDPSSGLWGLTGGPSSGPIPPGLEVDGPLRPQGSGGGTGHITGVFINGREIHPDEVMYLWALFGAVEPGRHWLGPNPVGGLEGGPPAFVVFGVAAAR